MALSINEESLRLFVLLGGIDKIRPFADTAMRLGLRPSNQTFRPLTDAESKRGDVSFNVRSLCEWLEDTHVDDDWLVGVALATIAARAPFLITTTPQEAMSPFSRRRADATGVRFASSGHPQYRSTPLDESGTGDAECAKSDEACDEPTGTAVSDAEQDTVTPAAEPTAAPLDAEETIVADE